MEKTDEKKGGPNNKRLQWLMGKYLSVCETAVNAQWPFPFKRHPDYQEILEHVSASQGEIYWQQIANTCPEMLRPHVMKRFLENEKWGNPVTHNFQGYELSPTTLRYMKVVADLDKLVGRGRMMGANIVEIGVGYGGMAYMMNAWNPELNNTYLVDLPPVAQLAKKYLTLMPNTQKIQVLTTEQIDVLSKQLLHGKANKQTTIGISNYALTECDAAVRRNYIDKILTHCDYGYITVNMLNAAEAAELQRLVTTSDRMVVRLEEVPMSSPENHILFWGPKVEVPLLTALLPNSQSQIGQDRYVTHVFGDDATAVPRYYLEIGAHEPRKLNNTILLEKLGWKGLSLDIDPAYKPRFEAQRCNAFEISDVTTVSWQELFKKHHAPKMIDYLSMDVDEATLATLERFPFDEYQFRIMTVEHDRYRFGPERAADIRAILFKHGYEIIVKDIHLEGNPFEDWWFHPKHVSEVERKQIARLKADGIDHARIFKNATVANTTIKATVSTVKSLSATLGATVAAPMPSKWHQSMFKMYGLKCPDLDLHASPETVIKNFFQMISPQIKGTVDINPSTSLAFLTKSAENLGISKGSAETACPAFIFESDKMLMERWKREQKNAQVVGMSTDALVKEQTWNTVFSQSNMLPCNFLRLDSEAITQELCTMLGTAPLTLNRWNWIQMVVETAEQGKMAFNLAKQKKWMVHLLQNSHVTPVDDYVGAGIYVLCARLELLESA